MLGHNDKKTIKDHGSRLTAHGSRLTAHGSRLTAHGSRLTAHGSRLTAIISCIPILSCQLPDSETNSIPRFNQFSRSKSIYMAAAAIFWLSGFIARVNYMRNKN